MLDYINFFATLFAGVLVIVFREKISDAQLDVLCGCFNMTAENKNKMKVFYRGLCIIVGVLLIVSLFFKFK